MEDINYTDDGSTSLAIYGMPSAAVTCRVDYILYVLSSETTCLVSCTRTLTSEPLNVKSKHTCSTAASTVPQRSLVCMPCKESQKKYLELLLHGGAVKG